MLLIENKMTNERIAENSNLMPKGIKCGSETIPALLTLLMSTMPKGMLIMYPAMMPIRIDASFSSPFPKWLHIVTMKSVTIAISQFCQEPKLGFPFPPAIYVIAVG